jgi:hypothetical protein
VYDNHKSEWSKNLILTTTKNCADFITARFGELNCYIFKSNDITTCEFHIYTREEGYDLMGIAAVRTENYILGSTRVSQCHDKVVSKNCF